MPIVKARKDYNCDQCGQPIRKGDLHFFERTKDPKMVKEWIEVDGEPRLCERQIAVEYNQHRLCADKQDCCDTAYANEMNARMK